MKKITLTLLFLSLCTWTLRADFSEPFTDSKPGPNSITGSGWLIADSDAKSGFAVVVFTDTGHKVLSATVATNLNVQSVLGKKATITAIKTGALALQILSVAAAPTEPPLPEISNLRFVVRSITRYESPVRGKQRAVVRLERFYGKIDGESFAFRGKHETQELKLVTLLDIDSKLHTGDIIGLQAQEHTKLSPGTVFYTHGPAGTPEVSVDIPKEILAVTEQQKALVAWVRNIKGGTTKQQVRDALGVPTEQAKDQWFYHLYEDGLNGGHNVTATFTFDGEYLLGAKIGFGHETRAPVNR